MLSQIFKKTLFVSALSLFCLTASATEVTVQAQGRGMTYEEARTEALRDAIMQVSGVTIDSDTMQQIASATRSDEKGTVSVDETRFSQALRERLKGYVKSFQILNQSQQQNEVLLQLQVTIERYDAPGLNDNRFKISVQAFEASPGICMGKPIDAAELTEAVTEALQTAFVNTRKFSVLDRHSEAYQKEKEFLTTNPDVREIEKYIYPGETITRGMRTKIRDCKERIFKILKAFRLSDPHSIHNQEISDLFLISCIQCIIHESRGKFNYKFHHQEGEKTYRRGKIGLHTVYKGDEPRADALLYYWIRMITDYSYMNTGEYECRQLIQEYEELVLEALGKVLQCNSLYEMNCMCNHYVNLLDIS